MRNEPDTSFLTADLAEIGAVGDGAGDGVDVIVANDEVEIGSLRTERIIAGRADSPAGLPPAVLAADDVPIMPSLSDLLRTKEHRHRTFFTVVEDEETVERIVKATQEILGDLNQPRNGVLFVLPVSRIVGFQGAQERTRG